MTDPPLLTDRAAVRLEETPLIELVGQCHFARAMAYWRNDSVEYGQLTPQIRAGEELLLGKFVNHFVDVDNRLNYLGLFPQKSDVRSDGDGSISDDWMRSIASDLEENLGSPRIPKTTFYPDRERRRWDSVAKAFLGAESFRRLFRSDYSPLQVTALAAAIGTPLDPRNTKREARFIWNASQALDWRSHWLLAAARAALGDRAPQTEERPLPRQEPTILWTSKERQTSIWNFVSPDTLTGDEDSELRVGAISLLSPAIDFETLADLPPERLVEQLRMMGAQAKVGLHLAGLGSVSAGYEYGVDAAAQHALVASGVTAKAAERALELGF